MKNFYWLLLVCGSLFAAPKKTGNSPFDVGKVQYEKGNYARALDLFAQTIDAASNPTQKNKAYYFQGLSLFEMGLYYSSYISFRNVLLTADAENREVYEKAIKNAVVIVEKLNMTEKVGTVLEKLPSQFIPGTVASVAHYAMGVSAFKSGRDEDSMSHLKSVNPESDFYLNSLQYLGILATKKRDYREASFYFAKILELARGKKDLFPAAELARLDLARTAYSMKDFEKSIEYYSQFLSSSPYWLTVLLEASWPLMRVNDTTVSLGNLHTVLSPFYREELVGEAYVLRTTILHSLCKFEEMRRTLAQFFEIYDPILRQMQSEGNRLGSGDSFYDSFSSKKGLNAAFINYAKRDPGIQRDLKVLELLKLERRNIAKYQRNSQLRRMSDLIAEAEGDLKEKIGDALQKLHRTKLAELLKYREQANYLKVEIVTGEKDLLERQRGLPPKRVVDVETSIAAGYHFWPYRGEYWDDELGTYVYTTESACVN